MTTIVIAVTVLLNAEALAQHSLEKIRETEAALKFPEEVVLEPGGRSLYLTNTDGNPLAKDGKGSIGRLDSTARSSTSTGSLDWTHRRGSGWLTISCTRLTSIGSWTST